MLTSHLSQRVARPSTVPKRLVRMMVLALTIALTVALPGVAAFACNEDRQTNCGSLHDHAPPPETSSSSRAANGAISTSAQVANGGGHDTSAASAVVNVAKQVVSITTGYSAPAPPTYSCYTAWSGGRSYQSCHWR